MSNKKDPRIWLTKEENEIRSHVKGWTQEKYNELYNQFIKFNYGTISKLLDVLGIQFLDSVETISKEEIFFTIIDDWAYEQVKNEFIKLL
ncbi:hypothetical protein HOK51_00250 [Candidatus Woesearchaeota archaeon]|jgi:hypothetical protein|nr:hypothetical protein [Candidatus Woesearchaeota archaeon]MBT6518243.1 hypothetical protein [Candidatus Woesearchaeota archaeon]MBT7367472.1 hypothetical protein [Candidatus Woesearchaeota archaeon]